MEELKSISERFKFGLEILREVLRKCRIELALVNLSELVGHIEGEFSSLGIAGISAFPEISDKTVYRLRDRIERTFIIIPLFDAGDPRAAVIGPYLQSEWNNGFPSLCERCKIGPTEAMGISNYLATLALVPEGSPIFAMISTLTESLWNTQSFSVVDIAADQALTELPTAPVLKSGEETLVKMRTMERRYDFENEIMSAVTHGRGDYEEQLRASFSPEMFEKRVFDPLRNAKNYCIIMNTLLRKAAEQGGVHPLYLDEASSLNAAKIEALSSHTRTGELMSEMFRGYCRLVKRHAHKQYSPVVRRAVIMIDADLSTDLSAGAVAAALDVSLGYLSFVFKKEVGCTLSEYVRKKRMDYAEHLLKTTDLQVQSVAACVGIVDLNYFTRLFKAHTGKTPTAYRKK